MKSTVHPDGRVDLDGTPEELAAFERARKPAWFLPVERFGNATGPVCTCPRFELGQSTIFWGGVCEMHPTYKLRPPTVTAAAPATMTHAHPSFESAEVGFVPANAGRPQPIDFEPQRLLLHEPTAAEQAEFEHSLKVLGMPRVGHGG